MSSTLQASVFMVKNYSDNWHSIKNTEDLTMKQMFDISEKLISEQPDEFYGVKTINWEDSSWKYLSLVDDEQVISLLHTKVYVFSDSVLCLGKMNENPQSNIAWEDRLTWFKSSLKSRTLDRIDGEPMEFEWNIFPGFTTLQLCHKVQELLWRLSVTPEKFTGRIIFMSMFNDISWWSKDNKNASQMQRDWSRTMVISLLKIGEGTHTHRVPIHESILQRSAWEQRRWKIVDTLLCSPGNDWNCFSHNYFC